ncbi:unnamed protein product [Cylindrotheca closterium]|uniref:WW domain-containing protein n=1 Tax=Cylindrotheca closterium TaxID=2856 RepID=A0AAD2JNZ6_9STRA|nr:unnamed protein product [Cylindrotheca closterium]
MDKADDSFNVGSMMNEVDAVIAQNLKELSPEDREKSYFAIHGVPGELRETPLLVSQSLEVMEQEINQEPRKDAYNLAKSMKPEYVQDPVLRLKFLRGERFSARPAAQKLVRHFELKLYLFGASKLVKDIEQDDLSNEDMVALYSGYVQWSRVKDSSKRTVSIMFPLISSQQVPVMSRMRVSFYLRMIAMEDMDFQQHGTVAIVSAAEVGDSFDLDFNGWRDGARRVAQLTEALPGSSNGVHICFPRNGSFRSYLFSSLLNIAVSVLSPLLKVRVRIHRGETMEECIATLRSFGIKTDDIPKSPQDNEYQTNLLLIRRKLEQSRRRENGSVDISSPANLDLSEDLREWGSGPSSYDVILGRGQRSTFHPGNVRLRKLVDETKSIYDNSTKSQKTDIAVRLVLTIKEQGRFIQESEFGWEEVTDKDARKKVSHLFRDTSKTKWKKPPTGSLV